MSVKKTATPENRVSLSALKRHHTLMRAVAGQRNTSILLVLDAALDDFLSREDVGEDITLYLKAVKSLATKQQGGN